MPKEKPEEKPKEEKKEEPKEEKKEEPKEEKKEEPKEEKKEEPKEEEEVSEEEEAKLPFPMAPVVRLMKANLDKEKMIKKEVKIAMNKWLGTLCAKVAKDMNKFPYVSMHLHEFRESKRVYEDLETFAKDKERILAHFNAIKKDIERLERDLGKTEEE